MLYISEVIRVTAKSVAAQSFYEATYIEGDKGDTCPCCKQSSKMGQISPQSIPVPGRGFARKYTSGKVS